jgi:hypothetical protein
MTESENSLLKYYETEISDCRHNSDGNCSCINNKGKCECVDAQILEQLKELEQYRAIGTVEEVKMLKVFKELYDAYNLIGTIEEFRKLKYKKNVLPIATIEFSKEDMQEIVDEKIKEFELDIKEIRNKAIDDFVENITLPLTEEDIGIIVEKLKAGGTDE